MERLRKKLPSSGPVTLCVQTPEGFNQVVEDYGVLITPYIAAMIAKVSQQRIYNLIEQGKFTRFVLFGVLHLSHLEFEKWRKSPRKVGRPKTVQQHDEVIPVCAKENTA